MPSLLNLRRLVRVIFLFFSVALFLQISSRASAADETSMALKEQSSNPRSEPDMVQEPSTADSTRGSSSHSNFLKVLCGRGYDNNDSGEEKLQVKLSYIEKNLKLGARDIDELRRSASDNLLREKKLILILDIDQTLLHATEIAHLTVDERYLLSQATLTGDDPSRYLSLLPDGIIVKLRPFVRTFLKEASTMFEMYIYTNGNRDYALDIVKLLDPVGIYFDAKVIAREDSTSETRKDLDVVLGDEKMIVVLDDNKHVWMKPENQILMLEYIYFRSSSSGSVKSLSEQRIDESDGVLINILQALKRAHKMFFDPDLDMDLAARDVRSVLKQIRQGTLLGCKILFSNEFLHGRGDDGRVICMVAEELGASCCLHEDPSVTHVVSWNHDSQKAQWAIKNNKLLVNPRWIHAAYFMWHRRPEQMYRPATETGGGQKALHKLLKAVMKALCLM